MGQFSHSLFNQARNLMPGGVNSPVRACKTVELDPVFIERGLGSRLWDVDGQEYIDYVGSWGAAICGHANPQIIEKVTTALSSGLSFGAPTKGENLIAEKVIGSVPSMEQVRFVSSGTEACMSAIRLARGYTQKSLILKFDGHYHGHSDCLLTEAGSGMATLNIPSSAGIPKGVTEATLSIPFNSEEALSETFKKHGASLAAVILEPIMGNSGFIRPNPGYLQKLKGHCEAHDTLLIVDEVMTGFRVAKGGAQALEGIDPDLSIFGKVVGGGLPLALYGGKERIMSYIAPEGPVYQAGTLSGNPVAVAAGIATLEALESPGVYQQLHETSGSLVKGLIDLAKARGIEMTGDYHGGMFGIFFTNQEVKDFADAKKTDLNGFKKFYREMRERGIYWPPSPFEACFISIKHNQTDIALTLEVADEVFKLMKQGQ